MFRSVIAIVIVSMATLSTAIANSGDEAYSLLNKITTVEFANTGSTECPVVGSIDFEGFYTNL